jgi:hypothetical protein
MSAFTMGAKVAVSTSESLNLVIKNPLTGKPMIPHKVEMSCSVEVTATPLFAYNDGTITDGEWEWNASLTSAVGPIITHPGSAFFKSSIEGPIKALTFPAATATVFVWAYYSGVEFNKTV